MLQRFQNRCTRHLCEFSRFFEQRSLDDFHECKMSMGLYTGEKLIVLL